MDARRRPHSVRRSAVKRPREIGRMLMLAERQHGADEHAWEARRATMTLRTHRETLTFTHPFTLSGVEDVQAPGTYTVQTDEN